MGIEVGARTVGSPVGARPQDVGGRWSEVVRVHTSVAQVPQLDRSVGGIRRKKQDVSMETKKKMGQGTSGPRPSVPTPRSARHGATLGPALRSARNYARPWCALRSGTYDARFRDHVPVGCAAGCEGEGVPQKQDRRHGLQRVLGPLNAGGHTPSCGVRRLRGCVRVAHQARRAEGCGPCARVSQGARIA